MADDARATAGNRSTSIRCEAVVRSLEGHLVVRLSREASAALPSRGQVAVEGTINGDAFTTVVEPDGERGHWVRLDRLRPAPSTIAQGDVAAIQFAPVAEWPEPEVPDDLQAALHAAPDIADLWESITPMARWEWVRWVCATRNPATRARRVEASVAKMRSGKRRPCCFDLAACTDPELSRSGRLMREPDAR